MFFFIGLGHSNLYVAFDRAASFRRDGSHTPIANSVCIFSQGFIIVSLMVYDLGRI